MERHNDAYGTCPRCEYVGWHKYKKKAIIFGEGKRKYKVSLFKCPKCGKKFGFELDGDIPVATVKSSTRYYNRDTNYSSYYRPPKEEKNENKEAEIIDAILTTEDTHTILDCLENLTNGIDNEHYNADDHLKDIARIINAIDKGRSRVPDC